MSGTQVQAGSHNTDFLKGLDLIIDSLVNKHSLNSDEQATEINKIGPLAALGIGALAGGAMAGKTLLGGKADDGEPEATEEKEEDSEESGDTLEEKSHIKGATDLGDKTNLPPEMGKREEGSSIAEPMLRRREVRKATIDSMQRGIDLLKMMATIDKSIEKVDGTKDRVSDIQLLKAFGLCECTNTEDLKAGTLVHKMVSDRGSRPSVAWWKECIDFAKSFEDMEEPAFFATFLYHKPDQFNPSSFFKGLNDTGGQVKHGRAMSRDTEIDENIGAMGGGAIDGLGMSDDDDEPKKNKGGEVDKAFPLAALAAGSLLGSDDPDAVEKKHHAHKA